MSIRRFGYRLVEKRTFAERQQEMRILKMKRLSDCGLVAQMDRAAAS
jgi:hypothetical protein